MMTPEADDDVKALFRNKSVTKDVKKIVIAEKKAYDLVKELIEENVEEEFFVNSVYFLSEQHYQDVVEERSIVKLCGYPLCDNIVDNVPKQQYRISRHRVYDLTQRKFFCSDRCYKASEHVKKQIPTAPLWLRDPEKVISIELDSSGIGDKGEEISLRDCIPAEDLEDKQTEVENQCLISEPPHLQENSASKKVMFKDDRDKKSAKRSAPLTKQNSTKSVLEEMLHVLMEWVTERTLEHLQLITVNTHTENELSIDDIRKMKKLQLLEAKLERVARCAANDASKPDPKLLKQEAAEVYTQRVGLFYQGKLNAKEGVRFKDVDTKETKEAEPTTSTQPRVDSKNPSLIRRNILHQKLEKVCKDLSPHLPLVVISSDLKKLISTFNLSSTNVILRTNEYPLMAIIVMHLMSRCNDDVMTSFNQSKAFISHVLTAYKQELPSLQKAVEDVLELLVSQR